MAWTGAKSPQQLTQEINATVLQYWAEDEEPRFTHAPGGHKQDAALTPLEKKIFGIAANASFQGSAEALEFALTPATLTALRLEAFSPRREKIGFVTLDLKQAALGYRGSLDETLQRFDSSWAREIGESAQDNWLYMTRSMFRLFIVQDLSDLYKVAFAFPTWTEKNQLTDLPELYTFERQPIEILLLRDCSSAKTRRAANVHLLEPGGQWRAWCARPLGSISRASRPSSFSSWPVTG